MFQPIRGWGSHLVFLIGLKNTKLVEDVGILLPVKLRKIPFSSIRGEGEKLKVMDRRMTDRQRTTLDHNSALEPSAQVH